MKSQVVITMPVFNEEFGINHFLEEIRESLVNYQLSIVIIDDCSDDGTVDKVRKFKSEHPEIQLILIENEKNLGHGPSTLKGMAFALSTNYETILTIDGDGQFLGKDIAEALDSFFSSQVDVLEGVRVKRSEPLFRKISTGAVKILVWSRSHKLPADGNTPFRIYPRLRLMELISRLPADVLVPNVFISTYSRMKEWKILEMKVISIPSRGKNLLGSTWRQRYTNLPSRRFLKFCLSAFLQWRKVNIQYFEKD